MVIAAVGTVFAAGYLLWLYQRTAFGTPTDEFADEDIPDVHVPEWIAWAPMLVLILVIGIFPNLVFGVTDDQMTSVAQSIAAAVGRLIDGALLADRLAQVAQDGVRPPGHRLARARARARGGRRAVHRAGGRPVPARGPQGRCCRRWPASACSAR